MQAKPAYSFLDLEVYQDLFELGVIVHKEVLPKLSSEEKFGLIDQLSRASKSAPTQIAEGYAKKHQRANWQKYLNDCMGECNEMIVHLSFVLRLYGNRFEKGFLEKLIERYDINGRRVHALANAWKKTTP